MIKVAYLGAKTVGLECLKFLIEKASGNNIEIAAVFTNLNRNASTNKELIGLAESNNIPVYEELDEMLTLPEFDYIISVQYHKILKPQHIARATKLAINLHMAPLPEYRGCNQFSYAIVEGAKVFGTTLHVLDVGIDSGDIIAEKRFDMPEGIYVEQLFQMTSEKSVELFKESILDILNGNYTRIPQKDLVAERGTKIVYRKDIDKLKQIDLSWDKDKIERYIRATLMPNFEPPYTYVGGEKIYFTTKY